MVSDLLPTENKHTPLLSRLGKRDLVLSAILILLPPLLLGLFNLSISATAYSVMLCFGVFLFIRTGSRELNFAILARRFLK